MAKKNKKHPRKPPHTPPAPPPPPPPPPVIINIVRVHADGGDGPAIVTTQQPHNWLTGFVVIVTALQMPGFIHLNHPYKIIRLNETEFNLQEEDETGEACIPWNNNANGDGPNPGTVILR